MYRAARVAYVCADQGIPVFGRKGCSVHVQEVIRAMDERGLRVCLFSPRCEGLRPPGLERIDAVALPAAGGGDAVRTEKDAMAANYDLYAALSREGPFDFIYERYSLWSHAALFYGREHYLPCVLEVNAPLIEEQKRHRLLVHEQEARRIAKKNFESASLIVAVSDQVGEYVGKIQSSVRGNVMVIPNSVNRSRFENVNAPRLSSPSENKTLTIGFVGTLKPWHGVLFLISAFAVLSSRYPCLRLLIVGDGPERRRAEEESLRLGIARKTRFTGAVPAEEVPALLASMDIAVAPYPAIDDFYFSPLKVYEYMAAGLPVVVSRIGQLRDLVSDGEDGFFCEPGDPRSLIARLSLLIEDGALRQRLGAKAREKVLEHYTWDKQVGKILNMLKGRHVH